MLQRETKVIVTYVLKSSKPLHELQKEICNNVKHEPTHPKDVVNITKEDIVDVKLGQQQTESDIKFRESVKHEQREEMHAVVRSEHEEEGTEGGATDEQQQENFNGKRKMNGSRVRLKINNSRNNTNGYRGGTTT